MTGIVTSASRIRNDFLQTSINGNLPSNIGAL